LGFKIPKTDEVPSIERMPVAKFGLKWAVTISSTVFQFKAPEFFVQEHPPIWGADSNQAANEYSIR
jgi:hypothetical protein